MLMLEQKLSRRLFIKKTLSSLALLYATSLLPVGCSLRKRKKTSVLDEGEQDLLELAADALIPWQKNGLPQPSSLHCAEKTVEMLSGVSPALQKQVQMILHALDWAPLLLLFSFRRFSYLTLEQRKRFLHFLSSSRFSLFRQLFTAVKALVMAGYYSQEKLWPTIGYSGPWIGRIPVEPIKPPLASYDS